MRSLEEIVAMNGKEPEKPTVRLIDLDDRLSLVYHVHKALIRAGLDVDARLFDERAQEAKSFEELVLIAHDYVEVI